jgi:hypothetical protein
MAWFTKKKPVSPDVMGMLLVRASGTTMTDDLLKALAPTLSETRYADFDAELLIFALFPFDLAVVVSGYQLAHQVRDAIIRHSVDIANADRRESGRRLFTVAEWRDRALARFRQYGECLASPSGQSAATEPMYLLGKTAVQNLTAASSIHPSLVTLLSMHYTATLIFARKTVESIGLR